MRKGALIVLTYDALKDDVGTALQCMNIAQEWERVSLGRHNYKVFLLRFVMFSLIRRPLHIIWKGYSSLLV